MSTDVDQDALDQVRDWHDDEGCCKHTFAGGGDERACCVCDADAPCEYAIDESTGWVPSAEWCFLCNKPARFCSCDDDYERLRDSQMGI